MMLFIHSLHLPSYTHVCTGSWVCVTWKIHPQVVSSLLLVLSCWHGSEDAPVTSQIWILSDDDAHSSGPVVVFIYFLQSAVPLKSLRVSSLSMIRHTDNDQSPQSSDVLYDTLYQSLVQGTGEGRINENKLTFLDKQQKRFQSFQAKKTSQQT